MAHDPLCPTHRSNSTWLIPVRECDYCKVIAKAVLHAELRWQADEAEVQRTTFQDGVDKGQRDMLAKCITAIQDTFGKRGVDSGAVLDECTAALRALLEEKP